DPKTFFVRLHDERSAQSRLEDILGSETRNAVAKHDLIEIVRTDKERKPLRDENLKNVPIGLGTIGVLPPIQYGREKIEEAVKPTRKRPRFTRKLTPKTRMRPSSTISSRVWRPIARC